LLVLFITILNVSSFNAFSFTTCRSKHQSICCLHTYNPKTSCCMILNRSVTLVLESIRSFCF
jgi:hypothetical protein